MALPLSVTIMRSEQSANEGAHKVNSHMATMTNPMMFRKLSMIDTEIQLVGRQPLCTLVVAMMFAGSTCCPFISIAFVLAVCVSW